MGAYARNKKRQGTAPLPYPEPTEEEVDKLSSALDAVKAGGAVGFVQNIGSGIGDIGKGIGTLALHGIKDYVGETAQLVSKVPGIPDYDHSSSIDDLVKAMPAAIAEDYKARYGSGLDAFFKSLYEDPVPFVGDVLTVGSLGGGLAAKGAVGASRVPAVADDLARLAGGADDVGRGARLVNKILPGAAENVAAQRAGKPLDSLGGTRDILDELGRVSTVERKVNPFKRTIEEGVTDRLLSKPVGKLEQEIQRHLEDGSPEDIASVAQKQAILESARESDIARVMRPTAAKWRQQQAFARMMGDHSTKHVARRDQRIANYEAPLSRLEGADLDNIHLRLQGMEPTQGSRLNFDQIETALQTAEDSPLIATLRETVNPFMERLRRMEAEGVDPTEIEAGRRLVEWVAGEPLAGSDEVGSVIDEIRLTNFAQETGKLIEQGVPMQNIFERALKPLNAYLKKQKGEKGWDFDSPEDAFALDDALKAGQTKAPVYFPHIDPLAYSRSDFLLPWRLVGMKTRSAIKGAKRSEGQVFGRYLDGIENAYVKDARDAYAQRAAEVVKHEEVESFIDDMTRHFGRPITAKDQVAKGEVVVNLSGAKVALRSRLDSMEGMADALEAGATREEAFIQAMKAAYDNIDEKVAASAAADGNLWAVPKTVGDKMQAVSKSRIGGNAARVLWDAPNSFFRKSVLYWHPRFYVNNVFGNTTFLKLQGGALTGLIRQMTPKYKRAYEQLPQEVRSAIEGNTFHSSTHQRSPHLGGLEGTRTGNAMRAVTEAPLSRGLGKVTNQGQRLNNFIEGAFRKESFLKGAERELAKRGVKKAGFGFFRSQKRLEQVFEAGADPRLYKGAIDDMNKAMNNYAALGPWERNLIRRFVFPFWAFYKHAAKTLIKMPYDHPLKARVLDLIHETDQEMRADEIKNTPEWMQGSLPLGDDYALMQGGMNPFSGVGQNPLAMLAPTTQLILETARGRDTFTDKKFTSPDVIQPFGTDDQYRYDPNTGEPVPTTVRPLFDSPLTTLADTFLPQVGTVREFLPGAGATYSTGETIMEGDEPLYPTDRLSEFLRFMGVPVSNFDLPGMQDREAAERDRALTELIKRGLAP